MERDRFDALTPTLTTTGSRRGITRLLAGLTLGGSLGLLRLSQAEAKCKKTCGPCKRCTKGKCKPKAAGTACAGGTCQRGRCITTPPPPPSFTELACPGPKEASFTGTSRVAQTFVATGTGAIATANVEFSVVSAGDDFVFEIRSVDPSGTPTSSVLGSAHVTDVAAISTPTFVMATFTPPVPVTFNTTYALVVTKAGGGFIVDARAGDDCGGTFFNDPSASNTFIPSASNDLIFSLSP